MLVLGIDEAGRGPVIGNLVLAGVLIDEADLNKLKQLNVKDSKLLTPKRRELLFDKIKKVVKDHMIVSITPSEIDLAVDSKNGRNLNFLEAEKTAEIINALKPEKVILDCPSPNKKTYVKYLRKFLHKKDIEIIAEHKADQKYIVVSAASILAKVTRDREINELKKIYGDIGPGYPSNEITKKFIAENFEKHPEIFRKSWITFKRKIKQKAQKKLSEF